MTSGKLSDLAQVTKQQSARLPGTKVPHGRDCTLPADLQGCGAGVKRSSSDPSSWPLVPSASSRADSERAHVVWEFPKCRVETG